MNRSQRCRHWVGALLAVVAVILPGCGGGSGNGNGNSNDAVDAGATGFAVERAFPALSFNRGTDIQSQPDAAGNDRLFVVEQPGVIRVFDNDLTANDSAVFLDISDRVTDPVNDGGGNEQGLLGLAFHPDFPTNGFFYVHYTVDTNRIAQRIRVSRFTANLGAGAFTADPASEQIVLIVDQAAEGPAATNHNGGALAFSPTDGLLHIAVGDGGGGNDPNGNGQNRATLSGAILRIDVDNPPAGGAMNYGIPPENPFAANADARGEIFAYGLRNPFKITFDDNGDLWIGDVGQNALEEIDFLANGDVSGPNYGWDCREGTRAGAAPDAACAEASGFVDPVADYGLGGSQSVTGGHVYRGSALPGLVGSYIYADFIGGQIFAYDPANGRTETLVDTGRRISTFAEDAAGELYIFDFGSGGLFRLVAETD